MSTVHGIIKVGSFTVEGQTVIENYERQFNSRSELQAATKELGWNTRIALVGCAATKAAWSARAKDLYTSNLFRAARAYAEATCARWYILSAKFGLLDPERVIAPYEQRLVRGSCKRWGQRVGEQLDAQVPYATESDATIVCLAGALYEDSIILPNEREMHWESPLEHLGLGARIAWLKKNTPKSNPQPAEGR